MKNKNIAVNFKAYLIASRELFHINDSSDMTDMIDRSFTMLRVRGVCSGKKISMNKIYIFWELESRFGSWEPQSGPPENFPPPYLFLKNNFLAK